MKTKHNIKPRTELEKVQIRAMEVAANILADKLELDGLSLTAERQAGWCGHDAYHVGKYIHSKRAKYGKSELVRQVKVNFRNLQGQSLRTFVVVLGHEFRHAVQYATGLLSDVGYWTNKREVVHSRVMSANDHYRNWWKYPAEIDAREFEETYAKLVLDDDRFAEFAEYLDERDGEPLQTTDIEATCKKYGVKSMTELMTFKFRNEDQVYYMTCHQLGKTKWTDGLAKKAYEHELLRQQKYEPVMRDVELADLVSADW